MSRTYTISNISEILLPITDFRKNLSAIIENLTSPKILMKNDSPKAVLISYEQYIQMEQALEDALDEKLAAVALSRLENDHFISSDTFFKDLLEDADV